MPWNVDRHSRVRPAASTMVSASIASTAQATKTVRMRGSAVTGLLPGVVLEYSGDGKDEKTGWLVLIYRVPPEPTRLRSTVWRRIKSLGAIYLQNSAAALPPASSPNVRCARCAERSLRCPDGRAATCSVLAGEPDIIGLQRGEERRVRGDRRPLRGLSPAGQEEYTETTSPTPSSRRTRSTWSSCATGSPRCGSARVRRGRQAGGREGARRVRAVAGGLRRAGVRRGR